MKSEKVEKIAEDFINLSKEEKQEFVKRIRTHWPDWECKKYENPKTTIANVKEGNYIPDGTKLNITI